MVTKIVDNMRKTIANETILKGRPMGSANANVFGDIGEALIGRPGRALSIAGRAADSGLGTSLRGALSTYRGAKMLVTQNPAAKIIQKAYAILPASAREVVRRSVVVNGPENAARLAQTYLQKYGGEFQYDSEEELNSAPMP